MAAESPHNRPADELLSGYLDGELSADELAEVEARLEQDPAARRKLDELRAVSMAVRQLPQETGSGRLKTTIMAQIGDAHAPKRGLPIGKTRRGWAWAALAVAASLLIVAYQQQRPGDGEVARRAEPRDEVPEIHAPALEGDTASAPLERIAGGAGGAVPPADAPLRIGEEGLLVVHVSMPVAARDRGEFERVLSTNNIPLVDELTTGDTVAVIDSLRDRSVELPAGRTSYHKVVPPVAQAQKLSIQQIAQAESRSLSESDDVDVVLVEAPRQQVINCLVELQEDPRNFLAVEVDEPESGESAGSAGPFQQYNRGRVPVSQRAAAPRRLPGRASNLPQGSQLQVLFVVGTEPGVPAAGKKVETGANGQPPG